VFPVMLSAPFPCEYVRRSSLAEQRGRLKASLIAGRSEFWSPGFSRQSCGLDEGIESFQNHSIRERPPPERGTPDPDSLSTRPSPGINTSDSAIPPPPRLFKHAFDDLRALGQLLLGEYRIYRVKKLWANQRIAFHRAIQFT